MNNILLDELPTEYEGYRVNTSFRIGIQIMLALEDEELTKREVMCVCYRLLFADEDDELTQNPPPELLEGCLNWFLSGWYHDRTTKEKDHKKVMDFDIDQYRIYADFLSIYGINLNEVDMHWWAFQGLLWNMPHEKSSFLQTIELRTKKPRRNASAEEKRFIQEGHDRYDLRRKTKETYTKEEERKIDEYDAMMAEIQKKKDMEKSILDAFKE